VIFNDKYDFVCLMIIHLLLQYVRCDFWSRPSLLKIAQHLRKQDVPFNTILSKHWSSEFFIYQSSKQIYKLFIQIYKHKFVSWFYFINIYMYMYMLTAFSWSTHDMRNFLFQLNSDYLSFDRNRGFRQFFQI
jgi:hypothetical protein